MADDLRFKLHACRISRAITVLFAVPASTVGFIVDPRPFSLAACAYAWAWASVVGRVYRTTVQKLEDSDNG